MTDASSVRLATMRDSVEIAVMSRDLIEHGLSWGWTPERIIETIAARNTMVAVVHNNARVIAFGVMEFEDEDAHLVLFAVRPEVQRQGIGSAVLHFLETSAVTAGVARIRIEARHDNLPARCFYNEHGYHERVLKTRMYAKQVDGVHLEKWLRAPKTSDA